MVVGRAGLCQNRAASLVAEEEKFFRVLALIPLQNMVAHPAQEPREGYKGVQRIPVQFMGAGLVGAHGRLAANPVNPGHKLACVAARSHRLKMVGKHVQEQRENSACATRIRVQFTVDGRTGLCQHHAVSLVAVE